MSVRPPKAVLERFPVAVDALPSLALLFHKTVDIAGTGKRKIDGSYAATRLGETMTSRWANERFRQVMLLIRQFRTEWPNQTLLTADDTELIRSAIDVALTTASYAAHTGDIYDLNPTTWAIWIVQYVHTVRRGSWTAESAQAQHTLAFETLYEWLRAQHERGEQFYIYELGTKIILHRYKLPFKKMTVPPKQNELFKWIKGAKRLSDWLVQGGFAPIDQGIGSLQAPTLVAPPPQQSRREAQRAAMWERVASRARVRRLTSVGGEDEDATLTRSVVRSVMNDSRANEPRREMTDAEAEAFAQELEVELESQHAAEPPAQGSSSGSPAQASPSCSPAQASSSGSPPEPLSEYEQERLRNIARNRQVLEGLGLASEPLIPPRPRSHASAERMVRPAPGPPTRRSSVERPARNYAEQGEGEDGSESDDSEDIWEPAVGATGMPPPGAVVINLVSSDEDGPALLSSHPTRRGGLFIAPSTVQIEQGPLAGTTLREPGLFTTEALPAGSFVCMYTGTFRSRSEYEGLPTGRRDQLSRYAVEVDAHDVVITPEVNLTTGKVNFRRHPAAAANEPSALRVANTFTQASVVEAYGEDSEPSAYLIVCLFTCRPVAAGGEILWNYGKGYDELRQHTGYAAGQSCPEEIIGLLSLPEQNARVEATLAMGGARAQEALYPLADSHSSQDSSGDEWLPVKRVARRPRRA